MTTLPSPSHFPDRNAALAFYVGAGLAIDDAVKRCGFAIMPLRLLASPEMQGAIDKQTKGLARANLARCRQILMDFVENTQLTVANRIDAAKALQAMFGKELEGGVLGENPSEMSGSQLRDAIDKLQGEIGKRAIGADVIDLACTPVSEDIVPNTLDLLG